MIGDLGISESERRKLDKWDQLSSLLVVHHLAALPIVHVPRKISHEQTSPQDSTLIRCEICLPEMQAIRTIQGYRAWCWQVLLN